MNKPQLSVQKKNVLLTPKFKLYKKQNPRSEFIKLATQRSRPTPS